MISLYFAFWMFIAFFAIVGAMRGWAAELLVSFSAVLSIFIIIILREFQFIQILEPKTSFWVQSGLILLFAFFGYQTPRFSAIGRAKVARERVQDTVMGILVGGANGYLIMGSLWHYLIQINYQLSEKFNYIIAPDGSELGLKTIQLIESLPPVWLVTPWIYFAVAIAFAFVVIVFV